MVMNWNVDSVQRVAALDAALCQRANRACGFAPIRQFFAVVSWLGNGKFWYALMLLLPVLFGLPGLKVSVQMALGGVVGVALYKLIKHATHRPRPYMTHADIVLGAAPLDQFSFPSGHTLHAVMFAVLIVSAFPGFGWLLIPFTTLVACSRVVLGLHYPTDVLLGAAVGVLLAMTVQAVPLAGVLA
jgi:undecaprenyl-diphosphatase